MSQVDSAPRRYKIRRSSGEVEFVDRNELARLQLARAERFRRDGVRRRLLAALAAVALLAMVVIAGIWVWPERARPISASGSPAASGAQNAEPAEAAAARSEPAPLAPAEALPVTAEAPPAPREAVAAAVRAWAAAWSAQDLLGYLGAYSEEFRPADGEPREEWSRRRQVRLVLPEEIRVEISGLEVELVGEGRARARFLQSYRSPEYADRVRKTLELVDERGTWRIVAETADPAG